jgi:hypothetical protein
MQGEDLLGTAPGELAGTVAGAGSASAPTSPEGVKKSRLCRLMCGKARPFPSTRLDTKAFRLGRLPESHRLSPHQAAQPQEPVTVFHTFPALGSVSPFPGLLLSPHFAYQQRQDGRRKSRKTPNPGFYVPYERLRHRRCFLSVYIRSEPSQEKRRPVIPKLPCRAPETGKELDTQILRLP